MKDCRGTCNGGYQNDSCGECLTPKSPEWNSCVGCDGIANSGKTKDCRDTCGGSYRIVNCDAGVQLCVINTEIDTACDAYNSGGSGNGNAANSSDNSSVSNLQTIIIVG